MFGCLVGGWVDKGPVRFQFRPGFVWRILLFACLCPSLSRHRCYFRMHTPFHDWPVYFIQISILRCTGLARADTFGLSDPFVEVHWNGALIHRTHTKQRTLNPVWGDGTKAEEEEEEGEGRGEAAAAAAQERGEDEDERSGRERVVVNVRPDGSGGELLLSVYDADLLSTGDFLGEVNNNSNRQPSSYAPSRHLLMDASILLVDRAS